MMIIGKSTSLAMRRDLLRWRYGDPRGIVLHTTGAGPWVRWHKNPDKFNDPFEAAHYIYERISKYSGHYLVCGETGRITRLVPHERVAWHVGSKGAWRYKLRGWANGKGLGWWTTRFKGCKSPRDLLDGALWREGSANALTIGIEVSPPKSGPRDAWSDACWASLASLTAYLGAKHGIPLDRYHVFTHSDAHPLARITKAGAPWDPAPRQWMVGNAEIRLGLST